VSDPQAGHGGDPGHNIGKDLRNYSRFLVFMVFSFQIGDYILTPEICVERKSISDLIGSLNSGRLYNQSVAMTRYYAKPILLIEFDQNRPFHLQGHYMLSKDSTPNSDITQKLQLLTIHFPKLRLVWSPSPYATAQLFEEMKQGKTQPDAVAAAAVGSDDATTENENLSDRFNPNVYDFLIKLPGINSKNIGRVMNKVKNLKELIKMSEEQLVELVDNARNAKMLWEIFHVAHKPTEANEKAGAFPSRYKRANRGGFSGRR
jgi:DNA excision repair protein ERCC-4